MKPSIAIPQPCHEDWNKMSPVEQGSFCHSCSKVVVDFSQMSEADTLRYLAERPGEKICGRFYVHQVMPNVKMNVPLTAIPAGLSPKKIFAVALFFVFGVSLFHCVTAKGEHVNEITLQEDVFINTAVVLPQKTEHEGRNYFVGGVGIGTSAPLVPDSIRWRTIIEEWVKETDPTGAKWDSLFKIGNGLLEKMKADARRPSDSLNTTGDPILFFPDTTVVDTLMLGDTSVADTAAIEPLAEDSLVVTPDSGTKQAPRYVWSNDQQVTIESSVFLNPMVFGTIGGCIWTPPSLIEISPSVLFAPLQLEPDTPAVIAEEAPLAVMPEKQDLKSKGVENPERTEAVENKEAEGTPDIIGIFPPPPELLCYPDPTTGPLTVRYKLNSVVHVQLVVTDIYGRAIRELVNVKDHYSGTYITEFDLSDLAAGIYIVQLNSGDTSISQKIILNK